MNKNNVLKKYIAVILAAVMIILAFAPAAYADGETPEDEGWDGVAAESFAGGSGTEDDPWLVSNAAELAYLSKLSNTTVEIEKEDGTTEVVGVENDFDGQYIKFTNDIDLNGKPFEAIGQVTVRKQIGTTGNYNYYPIPFCGHIDGDGHTLIACKENGLAGTGTTQTFENFIYACEGAVVENLTIDYDHSVEKAGKMGTVAANTNPMVEYGSGKVNRNTVFRNVVNKIDSSAGGIANPYQSNLGIFINCVNYGDVTSTLYSAGIGSGAAYNCVNYGKITGNRTAAGIVGSTNGGKAYNCINYGEIVSPGNAAGIVRGTSGNYSQVAINCVNYGKVTSTGTNANAQWAAIAGGIVGDDYAINYDEHVFCGNINYGEVSAGSGVVGGIVARLKVPTSQTPVTIVGNYSDKDAAKGALIGQNQITDGDLCIKDNYYKTGTAPAACGDKEIEGAAKAIDDLSALSIEEVWKMNSTAGRYENTGAWSYAEGTGAYHNLSKNEETGLPELDKSKAVYGAALDDVSGLTVKLNGKEYNGDIVFANIGDEITVKADPGRTFKYIYRDDDRQKLSKGQDEFTFVMEDKDTNIRIATKRADVYQVAKAIAEAAEDVSNESEDAISKARAAYDSLTDAEKAELDPSILETLQDAEARLAYLKKFSVTLEQDSVVYSGEPQEVKVKEVVFDNDGTAITLTEGTDYTVSYKDNTDAGEAQAVIRLSGDYEDGKLVKRFSITPASVSSAKAVLEKTKYNYTGKAIEPAVTVELGGKVLEKGKDFEVTYTNNVKAGKAKAVVAGKGNYTGNITLGFDIVSKQTIDTKKTYTVKTLKYKVLNVKSKTVSVVGTKNKKLKAVTIPATVAIQGSSFKVTQIGKKAFYKCKKLKKITVKTTTLKKVEKNALKGIHKKAVIKVPKKVKKAYVKLFKNKGQKKTVKIK